MSDFVLFGADYSVYARIPRLVLEEAGAAYRLETFDVFDKENLPAGYLDRHPFGKIPALEYAGFRLFETDAIVGYILDVTGAALVPDDIRARARMRQIMRIVDNYAYPVLMWDVYVGEHLHGEITMSQKSAHKLVEQVKTRLHLTWLGARWYQFVLYAAAAYALALVVLKLSGLAPAWVTWDQMGFWAVGAVPVLALIAALIFHRRPTCEDAAHAIDQRMQTKDLFLTDAMLDGAPGAFAPLVSEDAARQAPGIRPGTVVPYEWTNKTANAFAVLAVLALVMAFVPQFDLFGIHAEREHAQEIDKRLREQQAKAIQKKAEIRKAADRTALERAQTEIKLQQLEQTFRQMKRQDPKGNHEQLREQKKTIGELAAQKRKELDQDLKQGSKNPNNVRKFGSLLDSKARQFEDQLNKGEVGEVKEHIEQMKDKARQLAESSDPEEQQDLQRELQKMMDQLQQGLENGTSTEQLDQSVQDALDQMNMAGVEGMNAQQMQQAMESMQQSLGMAQQQRIDQFGLSPRELTHAYQRKAVVIQQPAGAGNAIAHLLADQAVGLNPVFKACQSPAQLLTPLVVVAHFAVQRSSIHRPLGHIHVSLLCFIAYLTAAWRRFQAVWG